MVIEYDGLYWHKNKSESDLSKSKHLITEGFELIRIREFGLDKPKYCRSIMLGTDSNALEEAIKQLLKLIYSDVCDVNLVRDELEILNSIELENNSLNLTMTNPEIIPEWDSVKNLNLKPEYFTSGSSVKIWWICSTCGYSYKRSIREKIRIDRCPVCYGRDGKVLKSFNDLDSKFHNIALEWDFKRNNDITIPSQINFNNNSRIFWWVCPNGHSYKARIRDRTIRGYACPYCAGKKVLLGYNDIESKLPNVKEIWDYQRNEKNPTEYTYGSSKKVYWNCAYGHVYIASIKHVVKGQKCPVCLNRKDSIS
jgi:rubrerythrin